MKNIENLQKEALTQFADASEKYDEKFMGYQIVLLNDLIALTYETAIKDCLASLPGEFWTNYEFDPEYRDGWNKFRSEIKAKLEALLPKT